MSLPTRLTALARRLLTAQRAPSRMPLTTIASTRYPYPEPNPAAAAATVSPRPHHVVVSLAGEDRVGIVSAFTAAVARHNGNVEESKMALLGGDFAMIVYISMPRVRDAERLARQISQDLPDFSVSMRFTVAPAEYAFPPTGRSMWRLQLEGLDQPGIVSAVAQALVSFDANVHEMETESVSAPYSGEALFKMRGKIAVDDVTLESVSAALTHVEDRFGSTISLEQISDEP